MIWTLLISVVAGVIGWWAFGGAQGLFVVPIVLLLGGMLGGGRDDRGVRRQRTQDDISPSGFWAAFPWISSWGDRRISHNESDDAIDHGGHFGGGDFGGDGGGAD